MYDFIIAGMLIPYISHLYFPLTDKFSILLAGSLTFMVGFIMRPVGALFFGYIGDIYGRKKALLLSIFGMAIATLLIGILPTYQTFSFFAPILMVLLRSIQGFCLGGEGQGANVFVLEHYKGENPGKIGALLATSNGAAALLGFFIGMLVTSSYAPEWAWRLCYLFGSTLGFAGLYLRTHIPDTPVFMKNRNNEKRIPILTILKERKLNVVSVILGVGVGAALTYTGFTFINLFLNQFLNFSSQISLTFSTIATIFAMVGVALGGKICDKIGVDHLLKATLFFILICIFPIHYLLASGDVGQILVALILLAISTGGIAGALPHFIASSFSKHERYTGAAFSGNLAQTLLGGIQPFMSLYLIKETHILWSPACYTFFISFIFLSFLYFKGDKVYRFSYNT
jgi:MFS transporter, MHS family, proline/betaine transporter